MKSQRVQGQGRATIEGEWAGRVTGPGSQQVEIAMMRTPDGNRLELARYIRGPERILIGPAQELRQQVLPQPSPGAARTLLPP